MEGSMLATSLLGLSKITGKPSLTRVSFWVLLLTWSHGVSLATSILKHDAPHCSLTSGHGLHYAVLTFYSRPVPNTLAMRINHFPAFYGHTVPPRKVTSITAPFTINNARNTSKRTMLMVKNTSVFNKIKFNHASAPPSFTP